MDIGRPVAKIDHASKADGSAVYVCDYATDGMLYGKLLRSKTARARILGYRAPKLPEGYFIVDKNDVPGDNQVHIVLDDTPVFACDTVEYIGDPILMVAGPDESEVGRILSEIEVELEELPAVLDMRESDTVFFDFHYGKGDVDKAFAEADNIYEEEFSTGYQEQAYLETQGMIARPEDGRIFVHGSMQCPYYVHGAVAKALGLAKDKVRVFQDVTGGGFGGKEAYPSILACQTAVAAWKAQKPVRVVFDRREDMEYTSKRHPSICKYKAAVKNGKVTAMDIDVLYNSGAFTTLSLVVLQRGIICANGIYNIENLKVRGRAVKTNTVPTGAFRGFGAPQTFFAAEMFMEHLAKELGRDPLEFKLTHAVRQGDQTSTRGIYHFPVPIPAMVEQVDKACGYREKYEKYKSQTGRYRRGIGMSMVFHGAGFTGSGERDLIKAVARLRKYADGTVEALTANTDMGQGLKTTFAKIIANELDIPLDRVVVDNPDTDRVPDSGPTVASRSLMIVGELLRRAAIKLKEQWKDGAEQTVEERFEQPDFVVPFDLEDFSGDAYPVYSWSVNAVELEVDTFTGLANVLGAWGSYDVGTPIDENIVTGQMEGGFLQGIGYASTEYMTADSKGRIRNNSYSDYIIPTSVDVPDMRVMLYTEEYPPGPYGAKGAGELPTVGPAPAYIAALEQALGGVKLNHAPFTAEDTLKLWREVAK